MTQKWNSSLYDSTHNFVTKYGEDVLGLLDVQNGETILDLGCGTGKLTADIQAIGADVLGIDSSSAMIETAQTNYPNVKFEVKNGQEFHYPNQFDKIFSNAALHWMTNPKLVIENVYNSLKTSGKFVFEMGGYGNIATIVNAIIETSIEYGIQYSDAINYFPKLGEYSSLLEAQGFRVEYAQTISRPTPLVGEDGLKNWVIMFRQNILLQLDNDDQDEFLSRIEEICRPKLYQNGIWVADYVRLRAVATKL